MIYKYKGREKEYKKEWWKKHYQKHKEEIKAKMKYRSDEDRAKARERYIRNGANYLSRTPEWRKAQHLKNKYGLSLEEYNQLLEDTGTFCPICRKSFGKIPPVIDHNHKTKKIRGIICRHCNLGIGLLGEDIKILRKAIKWIGTE